MLSKIWYLAYVEKPPTDIIQNIWKDILEFLWNYKKVRVKRNTIISYRHGKLGHNGHNVKPSNVPF